VNPIMPIIHVNGTSAKDLRDAYLLAMEAVEAAREALRKIEFNARDYYPVDGLWKKARAEMVHRHEVLQDLKDELEAIAVYCDGYVKEGA
jgi:hypothetical protein